MKFPRFASILFAALLILLAEKDVCAQWKNVAPNLFSQGGIGAMHYKDGIIWAGVDQLWFSTDFGKTWTKSGLNLAPTIIRDISFSDKFTGLVATSSEGVFLTHDGGVSWKMILNGADFYKAGIYPANGINPAYTWGTYALSNNPAIIYMSTDFGSSWLIKKNLGALGMSFAITYTGAIFVFSCTNSLPPLKGLLNFSADFGKSWGNYSDQIDGDSYTMCSDSCDEGILYLVNENPSKGNVSNIFKLGPPPWKSIQQHTSPYYSGAMATTRRSIYAGTLNNGVEHSADRGRTWKNIGGPSTELDTRTIVPIDNNTVFVLDPKGSIWETNNNGGDSLVIFPNDGVVYFSKKSLFDFDSLFLCNSSTLKNIERTGVGCNVPNILKIEIAGIDSSNYVVIPFMPDSIHVNFSPISAGNKQANLFLFLDDGTQDTISLQGYGIAPHPLSLATTDQSTDTIGGMVNVPITINGLDHAEDIDLVLHYDKELRYHGSYSLANMQLDMPNEGWSGRSKLHITQAKPNTILGYARFDVFNDSLAKSHVTFDSVTVLTAVAPCQYILPASVTSTITPPSGCGIQTVSRFMHDGTMPQLSIIPNPTSGEISISSTQNLGDVSITVYDMLGIKQSTNNIILQRNNPAKIVLPMVNGVYNVRVRSAERTFDLRVVVSR